MPSLCTYQIPNPKDSETRKIAQNLLDQAEEDLFFAIGCLRKNPFDPLNQVCYLLHQSLEKWVKVALHMSSGRFIHSHDLGKDLLPVLCNDQPDLNKAPDLRPVKEILEAFPLLKDNNYPSQVRYRENEKNGYNLYAHLVILLDAVFLTRLLVKKWLKDREKN